MLGSKGSPLPAPHIHDHSKVEFDGSGGQEKKTKQSLPAHWRHLPQEASQGTGPPVANIVTI